VRKRCNFGLRHSQTPRSVNVKSTDYLQTLSSKWHSFLRIVLVLSVHLKRCSGSCLQDASCGKLHAATLGLLFDLRPWVGSPSQTVDLTGAGDSVLSERINEIRETLLFAPGSTGA